MGGETSSVCMWLGRRQRVRLGKVPTCGSYPLAEVQLYCKTKVNANCCRAKSVETALIIFLVVLWFELMFSFFFSVATSWIPWFHSPFDCPLT